MRSRLAALGAPILVLALLPGPAAAAPPFDAAAAHRAQVIAYWTPERMRAATPRDFVFDPARGIVPAAKVKPQPTDPTFTTGASWTAGGIMLTATGKVYFEMDGSGWICSGSIVRDSNSTQAIVLTAGHCAVGNDGVFATNWMFIPAFDTAPTYTCANTVWGCWVASALYVDSEFAYAGSFNTTAVRHDWAFAVVGAGSKDGSQLDAAVRGDLPIQYRQDFAGKALSAFGYPAGSPYTGSDLVYCRGTVGTDRYTSNTTWSLPCKMTGGSSGGPWVQATDTAHYTDAVLSSLNSYGYSSVKSTMFGPMFNAETKDAYDSADSGSLRSDVVVGKP